MEALTLEQVKLLPAQVKEQYRIWCRNGRDPEGLQFFLAAVENANEEE